MTVTMHEVEYTTKVRAIVQFGPATPTSGFRGGEYFQCVIDPNMVSPGGDYIRFDMSFQGGEIHGWQRIEGLTVCEVLGDAEEYPAGNVPVGYSIDPDAAVVMRTVG